MKKFNYPDKPIFPFESAHPAHGYGGHAARRWGRYNTLTIHEVTALSFGMNPITSDSFWENRDNYGTMHIGMWNDRLTEIERAVCAGEIRKVGDSNEITEKTLVHAVDVEKYFIQQKEIHGDDNEEKFEPNVEDEKTLHTRAENTYLNIIAVLCAVRQKFNQWY